MRVCVREWKAGKPEETVRLDVTETRLEQEVNRQPQQYRMNGKGRREDAHQAMNCMNVECVYVRRWGIGVGQNRVARMALNAPRYAAVEALRGDMGWSTLEHKNIRNEETARSQLMIYTRQFLVPHPWNNLIFSHPTCHPYPYSHPTVF